MPLLKFQPSYESKREEVRRISGKCKMRIYIICMYCTLPLNTGLSRKTKWDAYMLCTEQIYPVLIQVAEPKEKRSLKTTETRLQDNIKTDLTETG